MTEHGLDLGLTDKHARASAGCGCGGGMCACGGHGEGGHGHGHSHQSAAPVANVVTTDLAVTGMTCGHCVSSVTEELSEVAGVESVSVSLNAGGVSRVTVASQSPLDAEALRAAVTEAGYSLADA
ncbi:heavy-metal-associated domain-containing protein [Cryobacterium sp. BB736]|uniref:heavy-metal-associated domain-containing protein n=1 Tax=Cryobacterium sp. BB736 TaxID=2746963 RepID=UPI001876EF55|nr:heavy-metal-associated domain-containing protein [Cryobacterium sp. BB736]